MGKDVIVACDFDSMEKTLAFLDQLEGQARKPFVKIGMELYYAEGPQIVREIKRRGHRIFLDLKLPDIPNQGKKAMAVLSRMDVYICNVHAAGTIRRRTCGLSGPLTRWLCTTPKTPGRPGWTMWSALRWRRARCMRPAERIS